MKQNKLLNTIHTQDLNFLIVTLLCACLILVSAHSFVISLLEMVLRERAKTKDEFRFSKG